MKIQCNWPDMLVIKIVREKRRGTHEEPVQTPWAAGPATTSQYFPAGREVVNIALHAMSRLLIATKPVAPEMSH